MALRKERLETIRKQLVARRQALATELTRTTAGFIDDEPSYTDSIDQASADADKTLAVHIANRERNVLSEIDEALRRIEEGSFGECESCGEGIAEARMRAYPASTLCIDCKTELESEQQRFSSRA
jgi:DnaK suppressor protein